MYKSKQTAVEISPSDDDYYYDTSTFLILICTVNGSNERGRMAASLK